MIALLGIENPLIRIAYLLCVITTAGCLVYGWPTGIGAMTSFWSRPNCPVVDPAMIALPVSLVLTVVVSLATRPPDKENVYPCFN